MKNLKKVLALVMACAMLFTMSSFAFTDVAEDATYLEAVTMLSKLGIINGYEDGTFLPDNTITRAEAAKVLVCALDAAEQAEGMASDEIFTDVPASHWAAGYVNYASNFGIVAGRGNGIFDPEAPVTYEEIVKMVVAMLGYTPVANVKGGYPTGYLYVANNMLKITKGATGVTGDAAKRWVVARLLFNSLEAKIMEQETWSASDPEYVQGDQTLLRDYLGVTKLEGTVIGTFYSEAVDKDEQNVTLDIALINGCDESDEFDDKNLEDYSDYIGEYEFEVNGTGAENYFGYTITAYVKDFTEDDELVAIAPKGNKNSTLEIAFDEFEADSWKDNKANYFTFEYYEDLEDEEPVVAKIRREVAEKDQEDAMYFLNGELGDIASLESDIAAEYGEDCDLDGSVRFLDNDGNGIYDFVFVETTSAEIAVKSINEKNYKVTGKTGTDSMVLDPDSDDYYVTFFKDGAVASFEDIAEDDILSVIELYDGNVKKVYISSETVEGRVSSTANNYKIAGNIYSKSNQYGATISKGDEGTFFLNYNGKIAYAESEKVSGGNYAFVLDVNTREPIFGTPIYTVLMMNEKGEWIQAELAAKVSFYTFDGTEFVKEAIEIEDEMADIATASAGWFTATDNGDYYELEMGDALLETRVIKYALNSAGEISTITIATDSDEAAEEDFRIAATLSDNEYNANRNRLAGKTGVAENAVVFTVDVDGDLADVTKKKEVSVAGASIFKDEELYTGIAFDDVDDLFGCFVITSTEASIAEDAALLVVDEIYEEENDDEEVYLVITGYMNGEEVTLETVADSDLESAFTVVDLDGEDVADFYTDYETAYSEGAILEVATDDAGLVTDIKVVYTGEEEFGTLFASDDYDADEDEGIAYFAGLLIDEELDGNYTFLGEGDGVTEVAEINVKNAKIYNVDATRKTTKYSVEDSIESFLDTLIYDDEDRTVLDTDTMAEEESEICFAVAKVVDGYAIDVVVYTIVFEGVEA